MTGVQTCALPIFLIKIATFFSLQQLREVLFHFGFGSRVKMNKRKDGAWVHTSYYIKAHINLSKLRKVANKSRDAIIVITTLIPVPCNLRCPIREVIPKRLNSMHLPKPWQREHLA